MTPDRFAQVAELFDALRDLPEPERAAALERASGDEAVRQAALSLLRHDSPTGAFLGRSATRAAADLLSPLSDLAAPDRIAGYRILRRLGRGGFATVFLAEQASPRRTVALKLIRPGAGEEERRRFIFEAEALARLDHPGIARVHESGIAEGERWGDPAGWGEGGAAYIVMEYVDGLPLDEHLREAQPTRTERLALLASLADAIEHAHIRGVVHRDLAPKNILVGRGGAVKVIDFGLARELRQRGELSRAMTMPGSVLGTLRYMSPEQLEGRGEAVDTRTDLYAMGIIAYDALVGGHPYLQGDEPLGEAVRRLQGGAARRPSEFQAAAGRELDAVLMKAVERRPDRRYQTAGAFAADLRNLALDRPVSARPASAAYRAAKFCKRNRWAVAAGAAVASLLMVAGGLVWRAEQHREESRAAAANVLETIVQRLLSPLAPRIGTLREREALLAAIAGDIEQLRARAPGDHRALSIDAAYSVLVGDVHRERGRTRDARAHYLRATEALARLAAAGALSPTEAHQRPLAIVKLGDAELTLGDRAAARARYEEALRIDEANAAAAPSDPGMLSNLAWSELRLAGFIVARDPVAADRYRNRALATARRMLEVCPDDWRSWEAIAHACIDQSVAYSRAERHAESAAAIYEAVDRATVLVRMDPGVTAHHTTLLRACRLASKSAMSDGDFELARSLLATAEASAASLGPALDDPFIEDVHISELDAVRAELAEAEGDLETALAARWRHLQSLERRLQSAPTDENAVAGWIATIQNRARLFARLGRTEDAAACRAELKAGLRRMPAEALDSPDIRALLSSAQSDPSETAPAPDRPNE